MAPSWSPGIYFIANRDLFLRETPACTWAPEAMYLHEHQKNSIHILCTRAILLKSSGPRKALSLLIVYQAGSNSSLPSHADSWERRSGACTVQVWLIEIEMVSLIHSALAC